MLKFTSKKMQKIDQLAQDKFFIPSLVLMENAGLRAADIIFSSLKLKKKKNVFIFCGPGNNGGDGFVVARQLINKGIKVRIFLVCEREKLKNDALVNFNILKAMKAKIIEFSSIPYLKNADKTFKKAGFLVDAVFGIGLNKNISGFYEEMVNLLNSVNVPIISLDIPSGLCPNTGKIFNVAVKAHTTITFAAAKNGFFLHQGPKQIGKLKVVDISIPRVLL